MSPHAPVRSIYRSLLRELPSRPRSAPSPIQQRVRGALSGSEATSDSPPAEQQARRLAEAEQFVQYLQAQRMYTTLLERYNPGMSMNEEERVRMTMRRVGMDAPTEWKPDGRE